MKNDISREVIEIVSRSYSLYPLSLTGYQIETHFLSLASNLDQLYDEVEAKHKQPHSKIRMRWPTRNKIHKVFCY